MAGRAGADVVRGGAERADISATIDVSATGGEIHHILAEQAISATDELTLRRVIGSDGRSRSWLNGQSVPLQVLRDAAQQLFDIHGQHEFQSLVREATQRTLLDSFGRHESLLSQVRGAHSHWSALLNRSLMLASAANERSARLELLRSQVQELVGLQLQPGEVTVLHEEQARVANRGRLSESVRAALDALYEAEGGNAHGLIARANTQLRSAAALDPQLDPLPPLLEEASIRVKEASHTLLQYLDALEVDPQRADQIERRLAAIEELARKHRVASTDLGPKQSELEQELAGLEASSADLTAIRTQLNVALSGYLELASALSARRATAAKALAKDISGRMQELGMAGGRFLIEVAPAGIDQPMLHGLDRVEFRVSTNPGQPPRSIAKVASGGELARLSLAVQVACADKGAPCMVFDEVDAGIGGAVAEIVGRELHRLGEKARSCASRICRRWPHQGHHHLRVAKSSDGRSTRTTITPLPDAARVEEIARMLGGVEITSRARAHAKEMLGPSRGFDCGSCSWRRGSGRRNRYAGSGRRESTSDRTSRIRGDRRSDAGAIRSRCRRTLRPGRSPCR